MRASLEAMTRLWGFLRRSGLRVRGGAAEEHAVQPYEHRPRRARLVAARRVLPYVLAVSVAPTVGLADSSHQPSGLLVAALAMLSAVSVGMVATLVIPGPVWTQEACVLTSLAGLALVVVGAGGTSSGLTGILMVPVVWMALYGRRPALLAALAIEVAGLLTVSLSDGRGFSVDERNRALVLLAVSTLIAWTVSRLVGRLAASERSARDGERFLAEVVDAVRLLGEGSDPRQTVCQAVVRIAGASSALLLEPDGADALVVTASAGTPTPNVRVPLEDRSVAVLAYRSGQPFFIPETDGDPRVNPTLTRLTGARSLLVQPFLRDGTSRGVVVAIWPHPLLQVPDRASHALALLAHKIGTTLERVDLIDSLNQRATTDSLTGLPNRRAWRDNLPPLMAEPGPLTVALLDLDRFKAYNDTRGHLAGDELLQDLGRAWRAIMRPGDLLVRWGGEEFAVALPGCPLAEAHEIIERLRGSIPGGQTISAGVTEWDGHEDVTALMSRADTALYQAKNSGRDRAVILDPSPLPEPVAQ